MTRSLVTTVFALTAALGTPASGQALIHEFVGTADFDFLGARVAGPGDVDLDGVPDVLAAAYGYNPQGARAEIYSGATGLLVRTFSVPGLTDADGAGDVDGDGRADVIVGDASHDQSKGRAFVFSGATGATLYVFTGTAKDQLGAAVAGAGDVDNDGFPDLVVGAPQATNSNPGRGLARIHSGSSGVLLHSPSGDGAGDAFGESVDGAGDVDQDGHADVVVGARRHDGVGVDSGRARVHSGQTGGALLVIDGTAGLELLGTSVAGAGDVDQDGRADVVVGAPGAAALLGRATLHSGLDGSVLQTFLGDASGPTLGLWVDGAEDIDGDGAPDVVLATAYDARVHSGSTGGPIATLTGFVNVAAVAGIGDVDGDCRSDVAVGDPIASAGALHEPGRVAVSSASISHSTYGTGCPGSGGFTPAYASSGCAVAGQQMTLTVSQGLGGAPALLLFGAAPASLPLGGGCSLLLTPIHPYTPLHTLGGAGPGNGFLVLAGIVPPGATGLTLTGQAFVADGASPIGWAGSNGVEVGF